MFRQNFSKSWHLEEIPDFLSQKKLYQYCEGNRIEYYKFGHKGTSSNKYIV